MRRNRVHTTLSHGATTVVAGVVPIVMLLSVATASATGAPAAITDQPGVTSPAQPGTSTPPPPPEPEPAPPPVYYEQAPEIRNGSGPRPAPLVEEPVEPIAIEDLHLPEPVEPVAPIEPPENTIRVGQWEAPRPDWLPPECADAINDTAAGAEAQVATALDSVGIPAGRSDRVSGATLGGAALGGAGGAVVAGAPVAALGAVVGGLVGGTVGGIAGALVGTVIPVPVLGTVTSGVAGTAVGAAAGAAAGAALLGGAAAVVGAVAGGTVGAGFGAGVGVGQP
ncbi:hypothetical protein [Nocardia australiensis]|uniref:hypothetical protein n=1 Tax=Nocardia australiensis TaxID=2887191 RepID=UPI001D1366D1|nr:hypothetical protein [Nocardia australiensis]